MNRQHGFTLIELLIVVAIVGILSMIAVPSYSNYVISGRIADATSNLADKRVKMEQFFQDNYRYDKTRGGTDNSFCANDTASSEYFDFSCEAAKNSYTWTATGKKNMSGFSYTINQKNTKTTKITHASDWKAESASCWIIKQGGGC